MAEKRGWHEPLVWSQALKGKDDQSRFETLNWNFIPWDVWEFNEDIRFGDSGMDRVPAQVIAHILFFFSEQKDLVLDPMAASAVCSDTCLALNRRCWSLDMEDRPDTRPEVEPYCWNLEGRWEDMPILFSKEKPDLIICEPPWFDKNARGDLQQSISGLPKKEYLGFLEKIFLFLKKASKKKTRFAFIGRDFRDYENCPAVKEDPDQAILIDSYYKILKKAGWKLTHIIQAPLSSDRFDAQMVEQMQRERILGTTGRYVMMLA